MDDGRSPLENEAVALPRNDAGLVSPGDVLKRRWKIERVIGTGGMGTVVAARHVGLGHVAAIKILVSTDPESRERFEREARAMATLTSKHTARVHDVDADGETQFMVMDLLEGTDLAHLPAPPSVRDACLWMEQACEALEEAHDKGIIHRDIKPQNLFLARDADGTSSIRVLDFGVARRTSGDVDMVTLTKVGSVIGTLAYMAPEQLRSSKNVDARTDLWSLGACLYKLLAGVRPFESKSQLEVVEGIVLRDPPPLSAHRRDVPVEVEAIVMKCLRKEPSERFASAKELRRALVMARTSPLQVTMPMAPDGRAAPAQAGRPPMVVPAVTPRAPSPQPPSSARPAVPSSAAPPVPTSGRGQPPEKRTLSLGLVIAFATAAALFLAGIVLAILTALARR